MTRLAVMNFRLMYHVQRDILIGVDLERPRNGIVVGAWALVENES